MGASSDHTPNASQPCHLPMDKGVIISQPCHFPTIKDLEKLYISPLPFARVKGFSKKVAQYLERGTSLPCLQPGTNFFIKRWYNIAQKWNIEPFLLFGSRGSTMQYEMNARQLYNSIYIITS